MRIPFDLIAAILCIEGVAKCLSPAGVPAGWGLALSSWAGFLLVTWLLNELVTRDFEWRTRFGLNPAGLAGSRHPLTINTWSITAAQCVTVVLYGLLLWNLKWPLLMADWPRWLGLSIRDAKIGNLKLADSSLAAVLLNLTPFLLAMVISWVPRRRLISGARKWRVPLFKFLAFEAKLTWVPMAISVVAWGFQDIGRALPPRDTAWMSIPGVDILLLVSFFLIMSAIGLPAFIIRLWKCTPMPEGELKSRLLVLLQRSGVKARAILIWGGSGTGLLNACVMGPWAPFRYVLISPQLVHELSMEETEAVLCHELGHARYGHLTLLMIMVLCLSAILDPLSQLMPLSWQDNPLVMSAAILAFVIFYVWAFFGAMMRQCEREADLASAELMGTPVPLVTALEKLASIAGNIRSVWCWHHGSIAERVDAVKRLSTDPVGSHRFHAKLRLVRIVFTVLTFAALGAQLWVKLTN